MRGEDVIYISRNFNEPETPPRTWGRRRQRTGGRPQCRNTPTHVGKTLPTGQLKSLIEKHPHARGEDYLYLEGEPFPPETPPRTWGRPGLTKRAGWTLRNTPTHVGKTARCPGLLLRQEKHPHARGEDINISAYSHIHLETPPRTWGRHCHLNCLKKSVRNTPTHVGKTLFSGKPEPVHQKHPHARGEDPPEEVPEEG